MAAFYGTLQGHRGEATRLGTKNSGIRTIPASWQGSVRVEVYEGANGVVMTSIRLDDWRGGGVKSPKTVYSGPINPTEEQFLEGVGAHFAHALNPHG